LDVRTFWILFFLGAAAIGIICLAIQSRQVKQIRFENERLRRELAALREELTLYQTMVLPVQQSSPAARIEPVLAPEQLRPETATARTDGAAKAERPATPRQASAARKVPVELASTRRLFIVQTAIVIVGASLLALAAYAIFNVLLSRGAYPITQAYFWPTSCNDSNVGMAQSHPVGVASLSETFLPRTYSARSRSPMPSLSARSISASSKCHRLRQWSLPMTWPSSKNYGEIGHRL
jgi:hypothetical protein